MYKRRMFQWIVAFCLGISVFLPGQASAQDAHIQVEFFFSNSCSHCMAEKEFLSGMEKQYPLKIDRYDISKEETIPIMKERLERHDALKFFGSVPITMVEDEYFVGFSASKAEEMEAAFQRHVSVDVQEKETSAYTFSVPFLGQVSSERFSLPVLAATLGFFDGFNVCSLGALAMILGMILTLRSRKKIALYGGAFVIVTALTYGMLIVFWYKFFETLSVYMSGLTFVIGIIGIGGGIYFLMEFLRFRKHGIACESQGSKILAYFSKKLHLTMQKKHSIIPILGAIGLFACIVTLVEFPCSAAIPVMFAAMLAEVQVSSWGYMAYISLFTFFYMLDEIILLAFAFYKLRMWFSQEKFVLYSVLFEGMVLFMLGFWYMYSFLRL